MRIGCDVCSANYTISDDKVIDKVFKFRCKKCSNLIMARGVSSTEVSPTEVSTAGGLHAARRETSALFSLDTLAATRAAAPAPRAEEGSGLLDIQNLAAALRPPPMLGKATPAEAVPVVATTTFVEPAVLVPLVPPRRANRLLLGLIAAIVALAATAIVLVVVLLRRGDDGPRAATPTAKETAVASREGRDSAGAPASNPSSDAASSQTSNGSSRDASSSSSSRDASNHAPTGSQDGSTGHASTSADASASHASTGSRDASNHASSASRDAPAGHASASSSSHGSASSHDAVSSHASTGSSHDAAPSHASSTASSHASAGSHDAASSHSSPTASTSACDEVYCVIHADEPCCAHKSGAEPDTLDRDAIAKGLASVGAAVTACRSAGTGQVKVRIAVRADGHVGDAGVDGQVDAALGACVVSAVQRAQFPRTKSGRSFKYTFSI